MKLVRTFHPVGHGAFYTEQFYEKGECVFTAVYDCGSFSDTIIERLVNDFVNDTKNLHNGIIDALFISHFHYDHISGIKFLIDKCNKVFLPHLTAIQEVESYAYNFIRKGEDQNVQADETNQFIQQLIRSDVADKFIQIENTDQRDRAENPLNDEFQYIEDCNGVIPLGVGLRTKNVPNWVYYPYNLCNHLPQKFIDFFEKEHVLNGNHVNYGELRRVCSERFEDLKDEYKALGHQNEYSMTIYSGYVDAYWYEERCCCCRRHHHHYYDCYKYCPCNPNCMFTGDFVASDYNVGKLEEFYSDCLYASQTIQVPHHGSMKVGNPSSEYGYFLYNGCRLAVFSTKFGKYPDMPANNLIVELLDDDVTPVFVTEDERTKLETRFTV